MKKKKSRFNKKFPPIKLTDGPFAGKTVMLAPQEQINFVSDIAEHFLLHVLKHPEALITDRSRIVDFGPMEEPADTKFRKSIIARAKKFYGVDISDVYDKSLPVAFHHVESRRTK